MSVVQGARNMLGYEKADDLRLVDFAIDYLNTYEREKRWTQGVGIGDLNSAEMRELVASIKQRLAKHVIAEKKELKLTRMINERKELRAQLNGAANAEERASLIPKIADLDTKLREAKKKAAAHLALLKLDRHLLALDDRMTPKPSIANRRYNNDYVTDKRWLEESISKWERTGKPALLQNAAIKADKDKKIQDLLCYPEVLKLLRKDPASRESLYKFIFRNMRGKCEDSAHIAAQFPATAEDLKTWFLDQREGRLGGLLTFAEHVQYETGTTYKQVRFKMNGEDVPLNARSQRVTFSPDCSRTVEEILASFAKKNKDIGEFECVQKQGILAVHPLPINVDQADWYKTIPPFETLNREEMIERYGRLPEEAFVVVKASRQHQSKVGVRVDDTHGWLQVVIPSEEVEGSYNVYPFGKYADPMPQSFFDKMFFVFNTQLGVIRMDENEFFERREKQSIVLDASLVQALRVFDKIKEDLQKEKTNDILFQAQGDNCAAWVIAAVKRAFHDRPELLEQLHDLYQVSWMECETTNSVVSAMQYVGQNISEPVGNVMRLAFSVLMGAWRGFTTNSTGTHRLLYNSNFLEGKGIIPAQLFRQATEINRRLAALPRANVV